MGVFEESTEDGMYYYTDRAILWTIPYTDLVSNKVYTFSFDFNSEEVTEAKFGIAFDIQNTNISNLKPLNSVKFDYTKTEKNYATLIVIRTDNKSFPIWGDGNSRLIISDSYSPSGIGFKVNGNKTTYNKGYCRINGQPREIVKMWTKINGVAREV